MKLIASGAQANVYWENGKAIKLFNKKISRDSVEYEAKLQKIAFNLNLPVPEIYDIVEIEGKYGIAMEYIKGKSIGSIVFNEINQLDKYLEISIIIQSNINNIIVNDIPSMKEILKNNISKTKLLGINEKNKIFKLLEKINFNQNLCHGDFHLNNLLETSSGIIIIDWVNSSTGNIEADIYRTYLLYKVYNEELSEKYLEKYCEIMKIPKENILKWAPIVAAARLSEGMSIKENEILIKIVEENI
jgi:tRNA A-37 threonylcarbamoyl transferase component Bud32